MMSRVYFAICRTLGRLLRAARYSKTRIALDHVRKQRGFYAPLLIWIGNPLMKILDTGVRVLPQGEWEERERRMYETLYGDRADSVNRVDCASDGTLILPKLPGHTLANILENEEDEATRTKAVEWSVIALAEFHRLGFTHGDAMAENVMVDTEAGVARWFDFETVHSSHRSTSWRRADDLRALLTTCLVRTAAAKRAETVGIVLDAYASDDASADANAEEQITPLLAGTFTSILRRSLAFHLAQAELPFQCYRECARVLKERLGEQGRV